jgi:hypothetical protein
MLRAGLAYALDALGSFGAGRHAAVHPAAAIRHCRRSAGTAAAGLGTAPGRVVPIALAIAVLKRLQGLAA